MLEDTRSLSVAADDIPEPPTPAPLVKAIAFDQAVPPGFDLSQLKDQCLLYVNEAMHQVIADARAALIQLVPEAEPYEEARITALSPEGFSVTLVTRKTTAGDMIQALTKMREWLTAAGYQSTGVPF